jgi:hypothetical protein
VLTGDFYVNASTCPSCGHCPACGRSNLRPVQYWPYWGYGPQWGYPYTYGAPTVIPTTWGINVPSQYGATTGTITFSSEDVESKASHAAIMRDSAFSDLSAQTITKVG